ncbi:MAG: GNAT family N-acetyltransferase [Leifsonia xyli]|nr:MAG: GNAT family N-acetyltransferase [Leifsonia xyli]
MRVREATGADVEPLALLAAATFPLACPPHVTDEAKAAFIAAQLSVASFTAYLADPARAVFVAEEDGTLLGYTMLVAREPADAEVAAAITLRPSVELSKCYVHPDSHGAGVASALMTASLEHARGLGAGGIWLGVNQQNLRAQRFYERHGFARVGVKRFLVGDRYEDDFVCERAL